MTSFCCRIACGMALSGLLLVYACCNASDDRSSEAMPDELARAIGARWCSACTGSAACPAPAAVGAAACATVPCVPNSPNLRGGCVSVSGAGTVSPGASAAPPAKYKTCSSPAWSTCDSSGGGNACGSYQFVSCNGSIRQIPSCGGDGLPAFICAPGAAPAVVNGAKPGAVDCK